MLCRASRFCFAAACGGQICGSLALAQKLVHTWTGQELHVGENLLPPVMLTQLANDNHSQYIQSHSQHQQQKPSLLSQHTTGRCRRASGLAFAAALAAPPSDSTSNFVAASGEGQDQLEELSVRSRSFSLLTTPSLLVPGPYRTYGKPSLGWREERQLPSPRASVDDPGFQHSSGTSGGSLPLFDGTAMGMDMRATASLPSLSCAVRQSARGQTEDDSMPLGGVISSSLSESDAARLLDGSALAAARRSSRSAAHKSAEAEAIFETIMRKRPLAPSRQQSMMSSASQSAMELMNNREVPLKLVSMLHPHCLGIIANGDCLNFMQKFL